MNGTSEGLTMFGVAEFIIVKPLSFLVLATGGGILLGTGILIDENTSIKLSIFVAGVAALVSATWVLSAKATNVHNRLDKLENDINDLKKKIVSMQTQMQDTMMEIRATFKSTQKK